MCGFLGFVSKESYDSCFSNSLDIMKHRGPDKQLTTIEKIEDFYVGLGHARLSIIDLSVAASQPFDSSCGRYSLIYNGEIYNYKELKEELLNIGFEFYTDSDTEVLINAWAAWGLKSLPKFIGMFSFIVLDRSNKKLTLVRDAFGIKPFFYSLHQTKGLFF